LVESYVNVNTFNAEAAEIQQRDRRENLNDKVPACVVCFAFLCDLCAPLRLCVGFRI